jgi:hypothetical protein
MMINAPVSEKEPRQETRFRLVDPAEAPCAAAAPAAAESAEDEAYILPESAVPEPLPQAEPLLCALGQVFNVTTLYGNEHGVTRQAVRECFAVASQALDAEERIALAIFEDEPLVNEQVIATQRPLAKTFVSHLAERDIGGFAITRGVSEEEFSALIEVLNATPDELQQLGGVAAVMEMLGIGNVEALAAQYTRIVADSEGQECAQAGPGGGEGDGTGVEDGGGEDDQSAGNGSTAVPFLAGQADDDATAAAAVLRRIADDPARLGALIMEAAEASHTSIELANGKTLATSVVQCLRRAYESLLLDPDSKTQKGKRKLSKNLVLVEKEILERLQRRADPPGAGDIRAIDEAVDGMRDELAIDALASDYVKKRNAIASNEDRILKYMRSKGADGIDQSDLQERLMASGLTLTGWHELLDKSGLAMNSPDSGIAAVNHLAELLTKLGKGLEDGENVGEDTTVGIFRILSSIDSELKKIVDRTERKILKMIEDIRADDILITEHDSEHEPSLRLSRRKLLEMLAEIGQELCQPLTVINCAIETIRSERLGPVTQAQADLLQLGSESTQRLEGLINKLTELSGLPKTLSPDEQIIDQLYTADAA